MAMALPLRLILRLLDLAYLSDHSGVASRGAGHAPMLARAGDKGKY
jgi:hypothetical protein